MAIAAVALLMVAGGGYFAYQHYGPEGVEQLRASAMGLIPGGGSGAADAAASSGAEGALAWLEGEGADALAPEGYTLAGGFVAAGSDEEGGWFDFEAPVKAEEAVYAVPVSDLRFSSSAPAGLRNLASSLAVDTRLGTGLMYDLDGVEEHHASVEQRLAVRMVEENDDWVPARIEILTTAHEGESEQEEGQTLVLTAAELDELRDRQTNRLAEIEARWATTAQRIAQAERSITASLPAGCDAEPLIREVVSETSRCQGLDSATAHARCLENVDRLNRRLGVCQEDQARRERMAAGLQTQRAEAREPHIREFRSAVQALVQD